MCGISVAQIRADPDWRKFRAVLAAVRDNQGTAARQRRANHARHHARLPVFAVFCCRVASFVRAVDENPPNFRVCYAGALGAAGEGVTPIWDLSEFVSLLDWTSSLTLFLRTGRAEAAAAEAERIGSSIRQDWFKGGRAGPQPRLKELGESLRQFARTWRPSGQVTY